MENKVVGVIGGMGPMATAKFMELVINNTKALKDQDNVDMLVCNYASIPDRTSYILGDSNENPAQNMIKAAKQLEKMNCSFIVMPCNTATYFYDEIKKSINIPFLNIVHETVKYCISNKAKKIGLMATDGTIESKVYEQYIPDDIELFLPNKDIQAKIMDIIYGEIKQNIIPNKERFLSVLNYFKENNCDCIIMGCTELSVAIIELNIKDEMIVDSLTVLAKETIKKAGKLLK